MKRDKYTPTATVRETKNVVRFIWNHPSNRRKRLRTLIRAALFQVRARALSRRTLAQLGCRSFVWADLHRTSASKVVYAELPDYSEMRAWQIFLRPGDLFIDVGANIGSYAVWAGELGAEVIALEPAQDTFKLLLENAALNGYPIKAIQAAAGGFCGTARFTSGRDSVNRMDPTGSVESTVVTIDSIINGRVVAGMKIDVEGFEIEVLRGCEIALSEHRVKLIQLEWNEASYGAVGTDRKPVAELLAKYGYRLFRPGREGVLEPINDVCFGADVFACADSSIEI